MLAFALAGCATRPDASNPAAVKAYEETNDPMEPLNRYFFELNRFLDIIILKPVATWYAGVVPQPARDSVHNFLSNLDTPVILANDSGADDPTVPRDRVLVVTEGAYRLLQAGAGMQTTNERLATEVTAEQPALRLPSSPTREAGQ